MSRNLEYSAELDFVVGGYGPSQDPSITVVISYDYTPPQAMTRTDPSWPADVSVNSVQLFKQGEPIDCPDWLANVILDAIDDSILIENAEDEHEFA